MGTKSSYDAESTSLIYKGATQQQLMQLFKVDHRTIKRKLAESGIKPVAKGPSNVDLYAVHEIAAWLIKPAFNVETYIKGMNHADLPKQLTKEYWAGLRSRQEYEFRAGNLWPTEKVVEEVGELMKLVKMSTLLMLDAVERQTELTERQRSIIQQLSHGMLEDLVKRIDERFTNRKKGEPNGELQEAIDDEEL